MVHSLKHRASTRDKLIPLSLAAGIILLDQLTKLLVVLNIEYTRPPQVAFEAFGDFFRLVHIRNLGVAFSLGRGLPDNLRSILFITLPLLVMAGIAVYYWRTYELSRFQRWCLAAIAGGGLGNLIDRIFRPEGVVDFLDFKFYGLFGLERWPTFNVADMAVVIAGVLLVTTVILEDINRSRQLKQNKPFQESANSEEEKS